MVHKKKIRKKILNLRKKNYNKLLSINNLLVLRLIKKFKKNNINIGAYYPVNYEIDCLNILNFLEDKKYSISLPVIKKNRDMNFYKWSFKDPLRISKFGIPEPLKLKIVKPDVLLIPLVAYDSRFYRIGYGGGYYDRYLTKIKKIKKIKSIGLAFSFQEVSKIKIDKYDQKLDVILTEKSFIK